VVGCLLRQIFLSGFKLSELVAPHSFFTSFSFFPLFIYNFKSALSAFILFIHYLYSFNFVSFLLFFPLTFSPWQCFTLILFISSLQYNVLTVLPPPFVFSLTWVCSLYSFSLSGISFSHISTFSFSSSAYYKFPSYFTCTVSSIDLSLIVFLWFLLLTF